MKGSKKYWLFLFPALFSLVAVYFHEVNGLYSVKGADPEYIYLANGLSVANGRMDLGNIDNPGIPMNYLAALSFRLTHLVRSTDLPFNHDVLANPDLYLRMANLLIILLLMALAYFAGSYVLKLTNNLWYAFLVQFTPFATDIFYGNIGRLPTEILMPLPVMLLTLMVLKLHKENLPASRGDILMLSAISALAVSLKLTMVPLLIIPFFLVKPVTKKIGYVILTIILFLIFALPVTLHLDYFFRWMTSLFVYSGNYGQGEKNFLNADEFIPNIINLIKLNKPFFIFTLFLFLALVASLFRPKGKTPDRNLKITSITLLAAIILLVLALGKNFKTSYFIPALMLLPLAVIMSVRLISLWIPGKMGKGVTALYVILVISVVLHSHLPVVRSLTLHYGTYNEQRMKAYHFFKLVDRESVRIVVPGYAGAPIPEFALMTSYQWSGKQRALYQPVLADLYPNSYILYAWDKSLNFWGDSLRKEDFLKPVYFYFDRAAQKEELAETIGQIVPAGTTWDLAFENVETTEVIYRLTLPQVRDSVTIHE